MAREYKDSGIEWIGQIPKEWKVNKGKQLYRSNDGGVWGEDATGTNDTIVLRSTEQDIDGRLSINEPAMRHLSEIERQNAMLKEGDLIITKSSGSPSHIGKTSIIGKDVASMDCCFSNFIQRIRIDGIPQYYWYVFNSFVVKNQFSYLSTTTTGINNINAKTLDQLQLLYPPLSDQQKIADYLDKVCGEVDEMISLQEQMIEELKAYKQSVITEAVTKGLDPNVPMKDSGIDWIGEVPEHWNQSKTLYVLSMPITDGPHTTPDLFDEGIPFISADAVSDGFINFENKRGYISESFYEECCKKYIPQRDDIYMIKSGASTGRTAIVETDEIFTIWSPLAVFRANKSIMKPRFLLYVLRSEGYQKQVENNWSFGTQQNIGMRTLERLIVCYPPLSEQQSIASYLDTKCAEIDALIAIKQAKIDELKEYKKSVIYEYVTGKKEVV